MNDDMLSQEEINALLKGVDSAGKGDTGQLEQLKADERLSEIEQDTLGEIGNISFGSAATALSTLLNQKVEITTPAVSLVQKEQLKSEFPKPHVAVHVQYTAGFEGTNLLVIQIGTRLLLPI